MEEQTYRNTVFLVFRYNTKGRLHSEISITIAVPSCYVSNNPFSRC